MGLPAFESPESLVAMPDGPEMAREGSGEVEPPCWVVDHKFEKRKYRKVSTCLAGPMSISRTGSKPTSRPSQGYEQGVSAS